jgi:hypothetical protein
MVAADNYAGHRGAQKGRQVNLGSRWQPATRRVRCTNPKASDAAFLPGFQLSGKEFYFENSLQAVARV